ncbi:MAG: PAS domain-containing protein [Pseudomonadota bacterium]
MHHRGTLQLFHYWTQQRGRRPAPKRADISPAAISNVLGNTFILEGDTPGTRFRLAGTRLCSVFGQELRGLSLPDLFTPRDRGLISRAVNAVAHGGNIVVGETVAHSDDDKQISLEILIMPLGDQNVRILGSIQFLEEPYWLGATPLGKMELLTLKHADPDSELVSLSNRPPVMLPEERPHDARSRIWHILNGGKASVTGQAARPSPFLVIDGGKKD